MVKRATEILAAGELLLYPGKNGYLIGADVCNPAAVEKIYAAKGRPKSKQLTAMVLDTSMAKEYGYLSEREEELAEKLFPGEIILVLKKKPSLPNSLGFTTELAFTLPNYPIASEVVRRLGRPITATSCNLAGQPIHTELAQVEPQIEKYLSLAIDVGTIPTAPDYAVFDVFSGLNIRRFGRETYKILNLIQKEYLFSQKQT